MEFITHPSALVLVELHFLGVVVYFGRNYASLNNALNQLFICIAENSSQLYKAAPRGGEGGQSYDGHQWTELGARVFVPFASAM